MNLKKLLIPSSAAFVFVFFFEWFFHGTLMMPMYEMTSNLWRPVEAMKQFFGFSLLCQFLFAFVLTFIFSRHYENKGVAEGVRFGLSIGVLIGIIQFQSYAYMPIPLGLAAAWLGGSLLEGLGIGIVLSVTYRD